MNAQLFVGNTTQGPVVAVQSEALSDNSTVWNLHIGTRVIPCASEQWADMAFGAITQAIRAATDETVTVN